MPHKSRKSLTRSGRGSRHSGKREKASGTGRGVRVKGISIAGKGREVIHELERPDERRALVQNLEELVVMNLVEDSMGHRENSMTVQDLVLSLTESTRRLGYGFGFSIGSQMNNYGKAHIGALFGALDRLGLGKVLYYPSLEHATITSMKAKANRVSLGIPVHIIEACYLVQRNGMIPLAMGLGQLHACKVEYVGRFLKQLSLYERHVGQY